MWSFLRQGSAEREAFRHSPVAHQRKALEQIDMHFASCRAQAAAAGIAAGAEAREALDGEEGGNRCADRQSSRLLIFASPNPGPQQAVPNDFPIILRELLPPGFTVSLLIVPVKRIGTW
jgi:hypothetical protein